MIITLGAIAVLRVLRKRADVHLHRHSHDGQSHVHIHFHEHETQHLGVSSSHSHAMSEIGFKPLLVGAMHGLAGSAALTLLVLTQIRSVSLGLLISDIGMPGEDGYDLMHRLRALSVENGGRVPAIALTAYARVEDRLRALRSGYQMHVPKPVELVAVATSLVKRSV